MFEKILVPLDGSQLSEKIFPWVFFLGETFKSEITLVRAFEPPSLVYLLPDLAVPTSHILSNDSLGLGIVEYLESVKENLPGINVECKMLVGEPASEILELSDDFDLVVMGSHGRGGVGRWLFGSVATKVARGIRVPLMVVNSHVPTPKQVRFKKILCPVDGSDVSRRSFEFAVELAVAFGAKLYVYRGVSQVDLKDSLTLKTNQEGLKQAERWVQELIQSASDELEIESQVVETYGQVGIEDYSESINADLICMGSHGKGGFKRWMLGSETEKVLQIAKSPVLVTH